MCTCGMTEMKRSGSAKYLLLSNIVTNYENFQVFKLQHRKNCFVFFSLFFQFLFFIYFWFCVENSNVHHSDKSNYNYQCINYNVC